MTESNSTAAAAIVEELTAAIAQGAAAADKVYSKLYGVGVSAAAVGHALKFARRLAHVENGDDVPTLTGAARMMHNAIAAALGEDNVTAAALVSAAADVLSADKERKADAAAADKADKALGKVAADALRATLNDRKASFDDRRTAGHALTDSKLKAESDKDDGVRAKAIIKRDKALESFIGHVATIAGSDNSPVDVIAIVFAAYNVEFNDDDAAAFSRAAADNDEVAF